MTISSAIEQAARLLWRHKLLAALGILDVILTSSGLASRAVGGLLADFFVQIPAMRPFMAPFAGAAPTPLIRIGQLGELYRRVSPYGVPGWIGLIVGIVVALIALAVIGLVIEGGVIAAVDRAADEKPITLGDVFAAGWRRILPMVVIASIPAIPETVGAALVVGIGTLIVQNAGGLAALGASPGLMQHTIGTLALLALAILGPLGLITFPLALLSVLAYRACILGGLNAFAAFRQAWSALRNNPGPALALVAVSYGVSLLAGAVGYLPGLLADLFLPAIVLLWLIDGVARAYYLALWTVGWRVMAAGNQTGRDVASG